MARREELTDEQWELIAPLIPEPPRREDGRGRPWKDTREVIDGVLWILRSGARWRDLPGRFPPYQTCHRRFQQWVREGELRRVLEVLAEDLRERGGLDLSECFIDGTFVVAKKGASTWEGPSGARVRSSWQWQTALVFLSPPTRRLLARMKSPLSATLSPKASPTAGPGHIRNLVGKARKGKAVHPIPFLDLDGVTVFPLAKLLEWAERPKARKRASS